MIGLAAVVLVLVVVVLAFSRGGRGATQGSHDPEPQEALADVLERAVAAGAISAAQRDAILALQPVSEVRPTVSETGGPGPARVPAVIEAVGYLGGIFVIVGALTLASRFWRDLATGGRLTVLAVAAAALTATGVAVTDDRDPVRWRLRSFVLLLASGALTGFMVLLLLDALDVTGAAVAIVTGTAVAAHSAYLWAGRDRPAQHLTLLGGTVAVVAGLVAWAGGEGAATGLALWALGGAWLLASLGDRLPPTLVGAALGSGLMLVAAGMTSDESRHAGALFGLATAAALVAGGIRAEEFVVTGVGVVGSFVYLPVTLGVFFGDAIGVPAVMMVSGLGLLGLTVVLLQRRAQAGPRPPQEPDRRLRPPRPV